MQERICIMIILYSEYSDVPTKSQLGRRSSILKSQVVTDDRNLQLQAYFYTWIYKYNIKLQTAQ